MRPETHLVQLRTQKLFLAAEVWDFYAGQNSTLFLLKFCAPFFQSFRRLGEVVFCL